QPGLAAACCAAAARGDDRGCHEHGATAVRTVSGQTRAVPRTASVLLRCVGLGLVHHLLGGLDGIVVGLLGGLLALLVIGLGRLARPFRRLLGLLAGLLGRLQRLLGVGLGLLARLLG